MFSEDVSSRKKQKDESEVRDFKQAEKEEIKRLNHPSLRTLRRDRFKRVDQDYKKGIQDCKQLMIDVQNVLTVDDPNLDPYASKWKTVCADYHNNWIKKCIQCKNEPEKLNCADFQAIPNCEQYGDQYMHISAKAPLFAEFRNLENILCFTNTGLSRKQIAFYMDSHPSMFAGFTHSMDLLKDPTVCLGITRGVLQFFRSILTSFFTYRILPILYRPKTMALIPPVSFIRISGLVRSGYNFNNQMMAKKFVQSITTNHYYPILPSWDIYYEPDLKLIMFTHPRNKKQWLHFSLEHDSRIPSAFGQSDWGWVSPGKPNPDTSTIWNNIYINTLGFILPPNFSWGGQDVETLLEKFVLSDKLKDLQRRGEFNLRTWLLNQRDENETRKLIMKYCITDFRKLYKNTKTQFPSYLKYCIDLNTPRHATASIFDVQEKRVLYFNSLGEHLDSNTIMPPIFLYNVLKEPVLPYQKPIPGDPWTHALGKLHTEYTRLLPQTQNSDWEMNWRLNWNTQSFQLLSGSCGLHSLFFFWYGCCNSYETIKRFWNLSPMDIKPSVKKFTEEEKKEKLESDSELVDRYLLFVEEEGIPADEFWGMEEEDEFEMERDKEKKNKLMAKYPKLKKDGNMMDGEFWEIQFDEERNKEKKMYLTLIEILINQLTELSRVLLHSCIRKCGKFWELPHGSKSIPYRPAAPPGSSEWIPRRIFESSMRCDLSQIDLGHEIQQLMPIAQFLVRVFDLKLRRSDLPQNLLENIRRVKGGSSI